MSTTIRPATSRINPAVVPVILLARPVHAEEHLVQAWDAIEAVSRGEKPAFNLSFAENRVACARAAVNPRKPIVAKRVLAECAEVEAVVASLKAVA